MSHEEFVLEKVSGLRAPVSHNNADKLANGDVPDAVDWREKNAVTPVKNQQQCGSCWAFSTTGAVEGAYAAATGTLYSLSEQELVDCSKSYGNDGCNGGLMDQGFQYVVDNKGLCLETAYKYTAKDGTCASAKCSHVAPITGYKDVSEKDLDELKAAIALRPVAVAIEADESAFQFYSSGVFDASCGTNLDHGVLAVGYGNMDGKDMWIVKNSWGATWGSKGYINLVRESGKGAGQCGIAVCSFFFSFSFTRFRSDGVVFVCFVFWNITDGCLLCYCVNECIVTLPSSSILLILLRKSPLFFSVYISPFSSPFLPSSLTKPRFARAYSNATRAARPGSMSCT